MNCTDPTKVTLYGEYFNRAMEWWFGPGPYDNTRIVITHRFLHPLLLRPQRRGLEKTLRLFNLTADPTESLNIAEQHMDIVEDLRARIGIIERQRPYQQPYWMGYDLEKVWPKTFKTGDCSINDKVPNKECHFTHPWLPDDIDPWRDLDTLTDSVKYAEYKARQVYGTIFVVLLMLLGLSVYCCGCQGARKKASCGEKRE
jgi:hypothetical protein